MIKKLISLADAELKSKLELIITDIPIIQEINEGIVFAHLEKDNTAIYSLLLFAGYLTYSSYDLIEGATICTLKIPNKEVKVLYTSLIRNIFEQSLTSTKIKQLFQSLVEGKIKIFQAILQEFILNSMSYHDFPNPEPEKSYHLFILGLLVQFHDSYEIKSNRESGYGRYDVMLIPRKSMLPGIVMEYKKVDKDEKETLEIAADNALTQIKEKEYATEMKHRGIQKIQFLGIAFEGKKVLVKSSFDPAVAKAKADR